MAILWILWGGVYERDSKQIVTISLHLAVGGGGYLEPLPFFLNICQTKDTQHETFSTFQYISFTPCMQKKNQLPWAVQKLLSGTQFLTYSNLFAEHDPELSGPPNCYLDFSKFGKAT